MGNKLKIYYSAQYLNWLLGSGDGSHPTNPKRAAIACELLQRRLGEVAEVISPFGPADRDAIVRALKSVHSADYVDQVLAGISSEWVGEKPQVAEAGLAMFAGTAKAVASILDGSARVAFNPQGAKHHAKFDSGEGFCVFNDMAYAALEIQKAGLKPLYLDWDIHAGNGVYRMLKGKGIPCISIHVGDIYPGDREMQPLDSSRADLVDEIAGGYNYNVKRGDGDEQFFIALEKAKGVIEQYQPDVILLAAGADGHEGISNLGSIANYTKAGYRRAAELVAELANKYCQGRVLIGGAGGYQPLKETPEIWADVVETIYRNTERNN
jgi:acetoin utilization protein AcuC